MLLAAVVLASCVSGEFHVDVVYEPPALGGICVDCDGFEWFPL